MTGINYLAFSSNGILADCKLQRCNEEDRLVMRCLATRLLCDQMHPWPKDREDFHCLLFGFLQIGRVVGSSNFQIRSSHPMILALLTICPFLFQVRLQSVEKWETRQGKRLKLRELSLRFWSCLVCGRSVKMHAMIGGAASSMAAAKRKVHLDTRLLNFPPAPNLK